MNSIYPEVRVDRRNAIKSLKIHNSNSICNICGILCSGDIKCNRCKNTVCLDCKEDCCYKNNCNCVIM